MARSGPRLHDARARQARGVPEGADGSAAPLGVAERLRPRERWGILARRSNRSIAEGMGVRAAHAGCARAAGRVRHLARRACCPRGVRTFDPRCEMRQSAIPAMNAPAARSAHDQLGELWGFSRLLLGLPSFLRQPVTLEQARATIRQRLERREQRFLRVVERGIYRQPRSPYLALLRWAGCAYGDLERLVRQQGVEGALAALRATGVYVGFEEFKGRAPIVRGGRVLAVRAEDFDNPALGRAYSGESGGSSGAGTRVGIDLAHLAADVPHLAVTLAAHGVLGAPTVLWRGVYPDAS